MLGWVQGTKEYACFSCTYKEVDAGEKLGRAGRGQGCRQGRQGGIQALVITGLKDELRLVHWGGHSRWNVQRSCGREKAMISKFTESRRAESQVGRVLFSMKLERSKS